MAGDSPSGRRLHAGKADPQVRHLGANLLALVCGGEDWTGLCPQGRARQDWHPGRYRGKPTPYGHATLDTPEDVPWSERWSSLTGTLALHIQTLRECGAEDIVLDHAYFHEGQCNHEFTPEQLRQVADLGIPFIISCYELDTDPSGSGSPPERAE